MRRLISFCCSHMPCCCFCFGPVSGCFEKTTNIPYAGNYRRIDPGFCRVERLVFLGHSTLVSGWMCTIEFLYFGGNWLWLIRTSLTWMGTVWKYGGTDTLTMIFRRKPFRRILYWIRYFIETLYWIRYFVECDRCSNLRWKTNSRMDGNFV